MQMNTGLKGPKSMKTRLTRVLSLWAVTGLVTAAVAWGATNTVQTAVPTQGEVRLENAGNGFIGVGDLVVDRNVTNGHPVAIQAFPEAGYVFVNWTGDTNSLLDNANNATTTFFSNGTNQTFTANFVAYATNTFGASPAGGGTVAFQNNRSGSNDVGVTVTDSEVLAGDNVDIGATPNTGYAFANWSGDVALLGDTNSASTSFASDGAGKTIAANFVAYATNTLTVNAAEGQVTMVNTRGGTVRFNQTGAPSVTDNEALADDSVDIEATGNPNFRFSRWTGDTGLLDDPASNATFFVSDGANKTISAQFDPYCVHRVSSSLPAWGLVSMTNIVSGFGGGPAAEVVDNNATNRHIVLIEAHPAYGFDFVGWSGDIALLYDSSAALTRFRADGTDKEIEAEFDFSATIDVSVKRGQEPYGDIAVSNLTESAGGMGDGDGQFVYARQDDEVLLTAAPAAGYRFIRWELGGIEYSTENPLSVIGDGSSKRFYAVFDDFPVLTVEAFPPTDGNVTLTTNGVTSPQTNRIQYTVEVVDRTVTASAHPMPNHEFDRWEFRGLVYTNSSLPIVTRDADETATAFFVPIQPRSLLVTALPETEGGVICEVENTGAVGPTSRFDYVGLQHRDFVELEAIARDGYSFEKWAQISPPMDQVDLLAGAQNDRQFSFYTPLEGGDIQFRAQFGLAPTITVSANPTNCAVCLIRTPPAPYNTTTNYGTNYVIQGIAAVGDTLELRTFPGNDYVFVDWTGDIPSGYENSPNPVFMAQRTNNYNIVANFRLADSLIVSTEDPTKGLVAYSNENGVVVGPTSNIVDRSIARGQLVRLQALPAEGYVFVEWRGDIPPDQAAIANASFIVPAYPEDDPYLSVTAYFEPAPRVIARVYAYSGFPGAITTGCFVRVTNDTQNSGGLMSTNSQVAVEEGNQIYVYTYPRSDAVFYKWFGDVVSNDLYRPQLDFLASGEVQIMDALFSDGDLDGDGMPDAWERLYGFDPEEPSDALLDADGDALANVEEYQYGTHPYKADTDADGMPDGWEVACGLDANDPDGVHGPDGNPDNDYWFTTNGVPDMTRPYRNLDEYSFFVDQSGGISTNVRILADINALIFRYGTRPGDPYERVTTNGIPAVTGIDAAGVARAELELSAVPRNLVDGHIVGYYLPIPVDTNIPPDGITDLWTNRYKVVYDTHPPLNPDGIPDVLDHNDNMLPDRMAIDTNVPPDGIADQLVFIDVNNNGIEEPGIDLIPSIHYRDHDGDGITNAIDVDLDGKADVFDCNFDGLLDGWDYTDHGYPHAWDMDGDGTMDAWDLDGWEHWLDGSPWTWDADRDGVNEVDTSGTDVVADLILVDACDNDGDGLPDGWDVTRDGIADVYDVNGDGRMHISELRKFYGLRWQAFIDPAAGTPTDFYWDIDEVPDPTSQREGLGEYWFVDTLNHPEDQLYDFEDSDNDQSPDRIDSAADNICDVWDRDGDGILDAWDADNDGIIEAWDDNGDGYLEWWDLDDDGDSDAIDVDTNGLPDFMDLDQDFVVDGWDTDHDGMPDGWEVTYGLGPWEQTGGQGNDGPDGNPDLDRRWVTNINDLASGLPGGDPDQLRNIDEYRLLFSPFARCSDPMSADTDTDGLPDGWEIDMGLDYGDPNGDNGAEGNPDGDREYNVTSGAVVPGVPGRFTNLEEYQATAQHVRNATTHPTVADVDQDGLPDHWETIFGYDAWCRDTDANGTPDPSENPDGDFYAAIDADGDGVFEIIHNAVSQYRMYFCPYTGWGANYQEQYQYKTTQVTAAPDTQPFNNLAELGICCPINNDTDGDGMWDGWELYVNLDPQLGADAGRDGDGDGISNGEEFGCDYNNNLVDAAWLNKLYPTDPTGVFGDSDGDGVPDALINGPDTDMDQITDSQEKGLIYGAGAWVRHCYPGGGGNPCTADTDGDHICDGWEHHHEVNYGVVDTTVDDDHLDPDGDGLMNYQEYWSRAVQHWQYDIWLPGEGFRGYDPAEMFQGQPMVWDWHYFGDVDIHRADAVVPFSYIRGIPQDTDNTVWYSTSYPGDWDSDYDYMDDFYECYHGLNPLYGDLDLVMSHYAGLMVIAPIPLINDVRQAPYINGHQLLDSDMDGLPNFDEALRPDEDSDPQYYHSDPTPHWITDASYEQSWVNLYYWRGTVHYFFDDDWMDSYLRGSWLLSPQYMYDFEMNEGFDTDNDNRGDRAEVLETTSLGATDMIDSEDPPHRRAAKFNGDAAFRTPGAYFFLAETLRQFTVEAWVRPTNPQSGRVQTIVERPISVPNGNVMGFPSGLRLNFRLGIDGGGLPFIRYDGSGFDPLFVEAKAPMERGLTPDEWTHLAGVYDGQKHQLNLYINGILADTTPSAERPCNGFIPGRDADLFLGAPIVIGATEDNVFATLMGASRFASEGSAPVPAESQPQFSAYFEGWIDEVRIWDEPRSRSTINAVRFAHFNRASSANMPTLLWAYSFDDLPDPDYSPTTPEGFRLLNGRPNDGSYAGVEWWRTSVHRSTVYNDYEYLVWVENSKNHMPLTMPADTRSWSWQLTNIVITGIDGGQTTVTRGNFPNSSNPYNDEYHHVELPGDRLGLPREESTFFDDLLPLRQVEGDEDITMWDQLGTGRAFLDSDGDGMPDWWEIMHGLDEHDDDFANGADGDRDLDGLSNYYEYISGTNPNGPDTDGDGILDINEDADRDGLSNGYEAFAKTMANMGDTDDDSYSDGEELMAVDNYGGFATPGVPMQTSDPLNSLDPIVPRAMSFDGSARLIIPPQDKLMLEQWTIQMWVKPDVSTDGGVMLCRYVADTVTGGSGINYEMGVAVEAGQPGSVRPYVRYEQQDGSEVRLDGKSPGNIVVLPGYNMLIPRGEWTHLTTTLDPEAHTLRMYINGLLHSYTLNAVQTPPTVFGPFQEHTGDEVTMGARRSVGAIVDGYEGLIDEVRLYASVKTADQIADDFDSPMLSSGHSTNAIPFRAGRMTPPEGVATRMSRAPDDAVMHAIVQFGAPVTGETVTQLEAAGLRVVNKVSSRAVTVHGPVGSVRGLSNVRWTGEVPAAKKVSKHFAKHHSCTPSPVVVRFYPGTGLADATRVAGKVGASLPRKAFLAETYLLVLASCGQVDALAEEDSVEYVMPGRESMLKGEVFLMSPTPTLDGLPVARYATQGDGWDGPGLGSADLTYYFANDLVALPGDSEQDEIVEAMMLWAEVAALTFTETTQPGLAYSIDINFAPVDGPGNTLAFAYFPMVGNMTFDTAESWAIDAPTDIKAVALHELGHSLGMGHSDDPDAIMYPFYAPGDPAVLGADDIAGIQTLYGKPDKPGASFRFDDGGVTAQDFVESEDWKNGWKHAAILDGAAFAPDAPALHHDGDGDGLPDWWELANGLDPQSSSGSDGANADADGDGLDTMHEYMAGTRPNAADTDLDGVDDYHEDSDGDGLANGDEQDLVHTHPGDPDTDDDGWSDMEEIDTTVIKSDGRTLTSPVFSRSPLVQRSLKLDGVPVEVPATAAGATVDRFDVPEWSLECWVMPTNALQTCGLIQRDTYFGQTNFALRLESGMPVVEFQTRTGRRYSAGANVTIPVNEWTHLSGVWDPANDTLRLYVNGVAMQAQIVFEVCARGFGRTTIGDGFRGYMDELRIWGVVRSEAEVQRWMPRILSGYTSSRVAVVPSSGDPVDQRLTEMGIEYTAITAADLRNPKTYDEYTSIFLPCMIDDSPARDASVQQYLRDFVDRGGRLYVACYSGEYVGLVWPQVATLSSGPHYSATASIVDPEVAAFVGSTVLDIPTGYDCIDSFNAGLVNQILYSTDTYTSYDWQTGATNTVEVGLIAFSFDWGKGKVIYTDFHSESGMQENPQQAKFLEWVVREVSSAPGTPIAYYTFDDYENLRLVNDLDNRITGRGAEDYTHRRQWAFALDDVTFATSGKEFVDLMGRFDEDVDGLPDWWENMFFEEGADPEEDTDEDGLNNLYEYYCDTNPNDRDTDKDGVLDGAEDLDGDGMPNQDELRYGSDPRLKDTDDDGINDMVEMENDYDPISSMVPLNWRALSLDGDAGSYVDIPVDTRLILDEWTIEAWVCPSAGTVGGTVLRRVVAPGVTNFFIEVDATGHARVGFGNQAVTSPRPIMNDGKTWTHIAFTYHAQDRELLLYLNGVPADGKVCSASPRTNGVGLPIQRIGEGFAGMIDEVRIWNEVRRHSTISFNIQAVQARNENVLVLYYRFEDGTSYAEGVNGTSLMPAWDFGQVEDFAFGYPDVVDQDIVSPGQQPGTYVTNSITITNYIAHPDWLDGWKVAGTLCGNAVFSGSLSSSANPMNEDYDGDGMSDAFELRYGLSMWSGQDSGYDPDKDGLDNLNEYLAGLNPNEEDSDYNGTADGAEDSDNDGLTNLEEANVYRSDPGNPDSDDDTYADGDEINGAIVIPGVVEIDGQRHEVDIPVSSPLYSMNPGKGRSMVMNGVPIAVPEPMVLNKDTGVEQQRFGNMTRWVVACWVFVDTPQTGSLMRRETETGEINFDLRLDANVPTVAFTTTAGVEYSATASGPIPTGRWVAVMGWWRPEENLLSLYVDDVPVVGKSVVADCATGYGRTALGDGIAGSMDDLLIAETIRLQQDEVPDFVLILDVSGSMSGQPLTDLKNASLEAIDGMPEGARMAIISFNDQAQLELDFTSDREELKSTVNGLSASGGTEFNPALDILLDEVRDRSVDRPVTTIFISDGQSWLDPDTGTLSDLADEGVTIHTVGFGGGYYYSDWSQLETIANETGGTFYEAPSGQELRGIMGGVVQAASGVAIDGFYPFDDGGIMAEDLLHPLDWDFAIRDITFDNARFSTEDSIFGRELDDFNPIPDWWSILFFGSGFDATSAAADSDGDGLNNYYEYLLGYNPLVRDIDGDLIEDGNEDSDGDGLSNLAEQHELTNPLIVDTDDDGLTDRQELDQGLYAADSISPYVIRYLRNDGSGYVGLPQRVEDKDSAGMRFNLQQWTLEATVRLTAMPTNRIVLIGRYCEPEGRTTFELGIDTNLVPYVRFDSPAGIEYRVNGQFPLALDEWTTLGARYGGDEADPHRQLSLFYDSEEVVRDLTDVFPVTGRQRGDLVVGRYLIGDIDEVRIWNTVREDEQIERLRGKTLLFGSDVTDVGSLNTSSGFLYQAESPGTALDFWTATAWCKHTGDGEILRRETVQNGYTFRMGVQNGQLFGAIRFLGAIIVQQGQGTNAQFIATQAWGEYQFTGFSTDLADGEWHHVAFVNDGATLMLFVDGLFDGLAVFPPANADDVTWQLPGNWQLIGWNGGPNAVLDQRDGPLVIGRGYGGLIDEVAIHSLPMQPGIIRRDMNRRPDPNFLVSYYSFDGLDLSGGPFVFNEASGWMGILMGAGIQSGPGANAPIAISPLDVMARVLAAYLPMDDGRYLGATPLNSVEDFAHKGDMAYAGRLRSGDGLAATDHIDFMPPMNDNTNTPAMSHSRFFDMLADSPWRLDADGDGMADVFEQYFGFDPSLSADANADADGDGLSNMGEYFANTDPLFYDSDGDGLSDGDEDTDGDGISNADEVSRYGSNPGLRDTDDDGITDDAEVLGRTDPANAQDPPVRRAVELGGTSQDYVEIPRQERFAMRSWTVEAWVCPSASWTGGGFVLYRQVNNEANYYIYINRDKRVVGGNGADYEVVSWSRVPCDGTTWTHILLSFDDAKNELKLYVNDAMEGMDYLGRPPAVRNVGQVVIRVGERFAGLIDEVRFWDKAVLPESLILSGAEEGLVAYYNFNDGTSYVPGPAGTGTSGNPFWQEGQVADFVDDYSLDWREYWDHAATLHGDARFASTNSLWMPTVGADTDSDGIPDEWEVQYPLALDPRVHDGKLDADGDGWDNASEYLWRTMSTNVAVQLGVTGGVLQATSPVLSTEYPTPPVEFTFRYAGLTPGNTIHIEVFGEPGMDGAPDATVDINVAGWNWNSAYTTTITTFNTGYLRQGPAYFFATFDNDIALAAGIAQYQPIQVGFGPVPDVEIYLTDTLLGYGRFGWTAGSPEGDLVAVTDIPGLQAFEPYFMREISYFHEGHYRFLNGGPLDDKSYRWSANGQNGAFEVEWETPPEPELVWPVLGARVKLARNEFVWTADTNAAHFVLNIVPDNTNQAPIRILTTNATTFVRRDDTVHYRLPIYAGDAGFGNGSYSWTVTPTNPESVGPTSAVGRFTVDLRSTLTGPYGMSGSLLVPQHPRVTGGEYVVQVFAGEGFSGAPVAQVHVDPNGPMTYDLRGIPGSVNGSHYGVLAFLDQNGNDRLDAYESYGFVANPDAPRFWPLWMTLNESIVGQQIRIMHRDTDNDLLPDAWEMQHCGNLTDMGTGTDFDGDLLVDTDELNFGTNPNNQDSDGDGLDDKREAEGGMGGPSNPDDDGDGVPTVIEVRWNGTNGYQVGSDMNPLSDDSDGDTYSDYEEIAAGLDPMSAASAGPFELRCGNVSSNEIVLEWDMGDYDGRVTGEYSLVFRTNMSPWLVENIVVTSVPSYGDTNRTVSVTNNLSTDCGLYKLFYRIQAP